MSELDEVNMTIAKLEAALSTVLAAYTAAWIRKSQLEAQQDAS